MGYQRSATPTLTMGSTALSLSCAPQQTEPTAERERERERERNLGLRAALPGLLRLSRLPHQLSASSPLKEGNLKPPKGFVRLPRDRAGTLKCEVHRAAQCELFLVLLLTAECGHP